MHRPSRFAASTLALLLAGFLAACESDPGANTVLGPDGLAPLFEASESVEDAVFATESAPEGPTRAAAWIGAAGGSVTLAGHSLVVPEGAVDGPLCFTMDLRSGSEIDVDLHAWEMDSSEGCKGDKAGGELEGTLWSQQFQLPVTLGLTYSRATNVSDPSDLQVAWLKNSTQMELLGSSVDEAAQEVTSQLDHFSAYALVIP